jgi:tetratricopeptide (TPR) repeat protein
MPRSAVCNAVVILLVVGLSGIANGPGYVFASPGFHKTIGAGQSGDELETIKANTSQEERIALLTQFIAAHKGGRAELRGREMLMQEYALKGEQALKEGVPGRASVDFKEVLEAAPAEITDPIFEKYIFPLPIAMNTFGYRLESVELMQAFEPRFKDDANRLVQIGFFYVQIEAPLEAVRILERAVRLAPDDHRAHNSLGNAYLINLRLDDAQAEFTRAIELDPRDEYANLNLANMLRAGGAYDKAVSFYRNQLRLKPDDADAHGGLALCLLALGRDEEADKEIAKSTSLGKDNYRFFTELAFFYASRKKYKLAREMVNTAARIEPRYAWVHIAKANVDALEGQPGDALSTMIMAQQLGSFPTLNFELAKALISVDGYDQGLDVLNRVFSVSSDGDIEATIGGVMKSKSPRLDLLLDPERRASLFLSIQTSTSMQYRLAEELLRLDHYIKMAVKAKAGSVARQKPATARGAAPRRPGAGRATPGQAGRSTQTARRGGGGDKAGVAAGGSGGESSEADQIATRPRRAEGEAGNPPAQELSAGADAGLPGAEGLIAAVKLFTSLDDGRQAFRMVWASRKLAENEIALDAAIELARRALVMAEAATEPNGSMRDAPLLDRQGRLEVFRGRAEDALGWALLKKGDTRHAIDHLAKSVSIYPANVERRSAMWHLAVATEQAGDEAHALDLYIEAFDPNLPSASVRRSQIEALYKKLKGTTAGLDERLRQE